jgi:hypothetical protein
MVGCLSLADLAKVSFKLNRELSHINLAALKEVLLEDKSIYMIFEYAEHDFLVRLLYCHRVRSDWPFAANHSSSRYESHDYTGTNTQDASLAAAQRHHLFT